MDFEIFAISFTSRDAIVQLITGCIIGAGGFMIGTLLFGHGYRHRIKNLEKELRNLRNFSPVNITFGSNGRRVQPVNETTDKKHSDNDLPQKTPKELVSMVTGLTSIKAKQIIQPYIGSLQTIRAEVRDVEDRDDYIQVSSHTEDETTVYFEFNKNFWRDATEKLHRKDEIEVTGYLESVAEYGVTLERCELRWCSQKLNG